MKDFYSDKSLKEGHQFMGLGDFKAPESTEYGQLLKYIEAMPTIAPPQLFGFHTNAEISRDLKETNDMTYDLLLIGGVDSSKSKEGEGDEAKLKIICDDILAKLPKLFNQEIVLVKYPISYSNSMNTVLGQEIVRYNKLIATITQSMKDIQAALKGIQIMSEQLEEVIINKAKFLLIFF